MSKVDQRKSKTVVDLLKAKQQHQRLSMVTCYDAAFGRLVEQAPVDVVLVGDSLGNVMLGFENTIPVTIDHMVHHCAAVSRVVKTPFLCGDMPFLSYTSPELALRNAGRLLAEGGMQGVKLEGGYTIVPQVKALVEAGIPVMGHLGLTPQSLHAIGGYRVQGREEDAQAQMVDDATALADAGVFAIVLEMVPASLAAAITEAIPVPTIGIGAGPQCDGQVLVLHDLLGFDGGFNPKFLRKYANLGQVVLEALTSYDKDVKSGSFPTPEQSF